ncbi:DUF5590 domain-containing protein [Lentibacillus sp. N15]|uniref:cell wall elongation regulator TseB-like domain-containing protein n=1 Tax=Lentibacillus songyuanensis TaxID=3136161 RepID=UPI0031BB79FE
MNVRRESQVAWFKWILIVICLVLIIGFIYLAYLYHAIQQNKTDGFQQTKAEVIKHTDLTEVEDISRFQSDNTYDIVLGKTKDQQQQYIFVPKNKKSTKDITVVNTAKIISKQDIIDQWKHQCNHCELIKVTPAMVDDKALWEVTYRSNSNRYVLDYLSIYDGKRYQQLRLKSMFN